MIHIVTNDFAAELKDKFTVYKAADVRKAWQAHTEWAHISLLMLDSEYRALAETEWDKVLTFTDTATRQYIAQYRDCDKYAFLWHSEVNLLLCNGVGMVINYTGHHAYNVILVAGGGEPTFQFIEPQTNGHIKVGSRACYNMSGNGLVIL